MYSAPGNQQEETSISTALTLTLPIDSDRLDSWKEIATHLKRTVRTVQRWERTEALPVHRHLHRRASSVYAWKSEVDQWWRGRSVASDEESRPAPSKATPQVAGSERPTVQRGIKSLHGANSIDIGGALGGILEELRGSVSLEE